MRILFLIFVSLTGLAFGAEKPNLVVFLADDAGWGDYSSSGNTQLATPHIDSLARHGISLENFYVCPLCAPTRAEFLTGRYYPRTGVSGVSTGRERLNLDEKTIADAFKSAGYATGAFGKWHNGSQWPYHPNARGFDDYFGHTSGHWGEYIDPPLEKNGRMIKTKGYIVDVCTDQALKFIEKNKKEPFFCYIPFTTPHSPWRAPDDKWAKFKDLKLTQFATNTGQENPDQTRCAYAMLENQDWNVGRVLEKLEKLGLSDETIVVYFSDNGPNSHRWNGGLKGKKAETDEGGVKSVCYLRWPSHLTENTKISQISGAIDLLPTLTTLAGIERVGTKKLDGHDLSPLFKNNAVDWPDRLIFSSWPQLTSVRSQNYRMDVKGRLFDMMTDPGQATAINEKEPDLAKKLREAVQQYRHEVFGFSATAELWVNAPKPSDERPLMVGYREFPITMLPARDGTAHGKVRRSAAAPNCSYFVNWTSENDHLDWHIQVHTPGNYRVSIDYTCSERDVGSKIELSFKNARLIGKIDPAWNPPLNTNQDNIPRNPAESKMKEFRPLALGEVTLPAGAGTLRLRALDIPGKSVMDLRRLTLTLIPQ